MPTSEGFSITVSMGSAGANCVACISSNDGHMFVTGNGSTSKAAVQNALQALDQAVAQLKSQVGSAGWLQGPA